jgi:MarR family transcriptional regulator for hemolysin
VNLDRLQLNITSGMVVGARHWRRICQAALSNYGISEACAVAPRWTRRALAPLRSGSMPWPAGLVLRSADSSDRRAKALSLTEAGRVLAESIEAQLVRLRHELFKGVERADLEATLRVIKRFEEAGQGAPLANS